MKERFVSHMEAHGLKYPAIASTVSAVEKLAREKRLGVAAGVAVTLWTLDRLQSKRLRRQSEETKRLATMPQEPITAFDVYTAALKLSQAETVFTDTQPEITVTQSSTDKKRLQITIAGEAGFYVATPYTHPEIPYIVDHTVPTSEDKFPIYSITRATEGQARTILEKMKKQLGE